MNKKVVIPILVILVVGVIVLCVAGGTGWAYALVNNSTIRQRDQAISDINSASTAFVLQASTEQALAEAQAQATATSQEAGWLTVEAQLQTTSTTQQALLRSDALAFATATQQASFQATEIAGLRHLSATQYLEIEDYKDSMVCDGIPVSIDFTSNTTVSASLKDWLTETHETIKTADWDVIWNGSETAIHYLEGGYYYVYIVYFDEPDNYYTASIYGVNGHCFLNQ